MKQLGLVLGTAFLYAGVAFGQGDSRKQATNDFSFSDDTSQVSWSGITPVIPIPVGESQWSSVLAPSFRADRVQLAYFKSPECPVSPGVKLFVRNAENGVWYETRMKDGTDHFPAMRVDQIWMKFHQTFYATMACRFKMDFRTTASTDPTPPPGKEEILAGVIQFDGGYVPQTSLAIPADTMIKSFRIARPTFCDADVLEAGTVTEGIYDPSTLVDKNARVYQVNHGYGSRVREIRVALNGPPDKACSLPVYVTPAAE